MVLQGIYEKAIIFVLFVTRAWFGHPAVLFILILNDY
jgi:hypothetical protein